MRKQIAAANWKMNLNYQEAEKLIADLFSVPFSLKNDQEILIAVPAPYSAMAIEKTKGLSNVFIAAQNCHQKMEGAFTGELSASMLASVGIHHIIIGHSERRSYFGETDALLAEKVNAILSVNSTPIFCCGESLTIREVGTQNQYVEAQLKNALFHLTAAQIIKIVIAYEPIWAIGTGKTATSAEAQSMHAHIRSVLSSQYGPAVAEQISILYGGSVKSSNAVELFSQPDVDGGLVGGAALIASEFTAIIKALK